ncbi:MAG: cyclic dehypoxanthinyl futalosine synthase [Planctomycetota bacterium]
MQSDSRHVRAILDQVVAGQRLSVADGVTLIERADLNDLGRAALAVKQRLHPEPITTYLVDRNINYTNVCVAGCEFCAFHRHPEDSDAYVLTSEELFKKIRELRAIGGTQILLQGGHHPQLTLSWYETLLRDIRREFPEIHIHAFSPSEIAHFSKLFKMPVREIVRHLKDAGLHSIPGGGGEILVDRVRQLVAPRKVMTDDWLNIMIVAAQEGLKSSATMVIGHVETLAERVEHLERLRRTQDEYHPFSAFIVWTMQLRHTKLEGKIEPVGAFEYLRTLAVARLFLDNILNLQSSWVTQGAKIGQISFLYGSNDWGGLMMEENVISQAGSVHHVQIEELRRLSAELGLQLRKRNFYYKVAP